MNESFAGVPNNRQPSNLSTCPVCGLLGCDDWKRQQTQTWHRPPTRFQPLKPTDPGVLQPCGENPSGTIREFFAHPDDVDDLLANGVRRIEVDGTLKRFRAQLTATPHYSNGNVQIRLIEEAS